MAGVTTAFQTGVHGSRPANGVGCIFFNCTTHKKVYRDDGTTWIDYIDYSTGYTPGGTDVAVADGGTGASTAAAARTNLGLAIGSNVQAWDADLDSLAGLGITAAGLALLDDANAAAQRTTLGISAVNTPITDTGGYYTGTEVEAALQEAGAAIAALIAGGGGVTVQDEGSPLSTVGTTLNFTGAGVTATGSGATKTINIPGGGGGGGTPAENAAALITAYSLFR